jgi:hypothetical protein
MQSNFAMFELSDLQNALAELDASQSTRLESVRFEPDCFASPSTEQTITACRGSKADFATAAAFWLHSLVAAGWAKGGNDRTYADSAIFQPIGTDVFRGILRDYSRSLTRELPNFLRDRLDLTRAQRMYDDWNDVAVIAESHVDRVTFHWETSA